MEPLITPGRDAGLVSKEIKDVAHHAALGTVDLCIFASRACHRREFLRLNIENLGEKAARGPELVHVVRLISALRTFELETFH